MLELRSIRYHPATTPEPVLRHLSLTLPVGEPVLARYNAPFTPWFMRRNEIWLALR